jgi:hypothetical protein
VQAPGAEPQGDEEEEGGEGGEPDQEGDDERDEVRVGAAVEEEFEADRRGDFDEEDEEEIGRASCRERVS